MSKNLKVHTVCLGLLAPIRDVIDAGTDLSLKVKVLCPAGCKSTGAPFKIMECDTIHATGALSDLIGDGDNVAVIKIPTPARSGEFKWTLFLLRNEVDGIVHEEVRFPFTFKTKPHDMSVVAWDTPSPLLIGQTFDIKVGAKCGSACRLTGKQMEIRDEFGTIVATGVLGEAPWPGTTALYWAVIPLTAPAIEGTCFWKAAFSGEQMEISHGNASARLSSITVMPPEHQISIKIVETQTQAAIEGVQVRLGPYRASTDNEGLAMLALPKGEYTLVIWKAGYEAPLKTIQVFQSADFQIEAERVPEEDPFAYWQG